MIGDLRSDAPMTPVRPLQIRADSSRRAGGVRPPGVIGITGSQRHRYAHRVAPEPTGWNRLGWNRLAGPTGLDRLERNAGATGWAGAVVRVDGVDAEPGGAVPGPSVRVPDRQPGRHRHRQRVGVGQRAAADPLHARARREADGLRGAAATSAPACWRSWWSSPTPGCLGFRARRPLPGLPRVQPAAGRLRRRGDLRVARRRRPGTGFINTDGTSGSIRAMPHLTDDPGGAGDHARRGAAAA